MTDELTLALRHEISAWKKPKPQRAWEEDRVAALEQEARYAEPAPSKPRPQ